MGFQAHRWFDGWLYEQTGTMSDYFLLLENLLNNLRGKYHLSPRFSLSSSMFTILKNLVHYELNYVKKKIDRKR